MSHFEDVQIRQWVLDSACHVSKKGTKPECIIKKAEKFYGFLYPTNAKIQEINNKKNEQSIN